jgi:hypothetical protein
MQVYQTDVFVSDKGIINLFSMPYLYNKKVKLVIIPTEDSTIESTQRKLALKRLLKRQETLPVSRWTDEELDSFKHERLSAKHL